MQTMPVYIKKLKEHAAMPSYGSAEAVQIFTPAWKRR